jgi:hypothetical protein
MAKMIEKGDVENLGVVSYYISTLALSSEASESNVPRRALG